MVRVAFKAFHLQNIMSQRDYIETACYVTVNMAIVSSSRVVVRRVMGCARLSGIDEGLHDNVNALLIQAPLNACNIAYGASCREQPLDQELRLKARAS